LTKKIDKFPFWCDVIALLAVFFVLVYGFYLRGIHGQALTKSFALLAVGIILFVFILGVLKKIHKNKIAEEEEKDDTDSIWHIIIVILVALFLIGLTFYLRETFELQIDLRDVVTVFAVAGLIFVGVYSLIHSFLKRRRGKKKK